MNNHRWNTKDEGGKKWLSRCVRCNLFRRRTSKFNGKTFGSIVLYHRLGEQESRERPKCDNRLGR